MPSAKTPASRSTAAAKKSSSKSSGGSPDALTLLETDHRDVRQLFKAYEKLVNSDAEGDERLELAEQICDMLTVHSTVEEEIFYPALREALDEQDLLDEAEVEHASAKELISQIKSMDAGDDLYDAKVTVLGEYVEHHVQEEENEMFAMARKAKGLDLAALGAEMQARKDELMGEVTEDE